MADSFGKVIISLTNALPNYLIDKAKPCRLSILQHNLSNIGRYRKPFFKKDKNKIFEFEKSDLVPEHALCIVSIIPIVLSASICVSIC